MEITRRAMVGLTAAAMAAPILGGFSADAQEATPAATAALAVYLLTIEGTLASATVEDARALHNSTAGNPASITAAQGLGDVSHMVYLPVSPPMSGAGNVLFMDLWTSAAGLNQFFANPQVQQQAGQLFTSRDPVVWAAANGFSRYALPAPQGKNDRVIVLVRGDVRSRAEAMTSHNDRVANGIAPARLAGNLSHDAYFRLAAPGEAETTELLSVDVWLNAERAANYYADPAFQSALAGLFTAAPAVSMWTYPAAEWTEW